MKHTLLWSLAGLFLFCCSSPSAPTASAYADTLAGEVRTSTVLPEPTPLPYSKYLSPLLCDGFDMPIGEKDEKSNYLGTNGKTYQGWYVATHTAEEYSLGIHTGEDWNGNGGGNTDQGQPVYSIGRGIVIAAQDYGIPWGNVVLVQHVFLNNHLIDTVYSQYAHLQDLHVNSGDTITKRQLLGTIGTGGGAYPAHLHLEVRTAAMRDYPVDYWPSSNGKSVAWVAEHYLQPTAFIKGHEELLVPSEVDQFLFVQKSAYQMFFFKQGELQKTYEIALSQDPNGHKVEQGDNRLPEGQYNIIQKARPPFGGSMADWFGTGWMRLNYPNPFDIQVGLDNNWISSSKASEMTNAWHRGKEPSKHTRLGGGVGIHGWNGDWSNDGPRHLTWGCISMHNNDLDTFFDLVELQTPIVIIP